MKYMNSKAQFESKLLAVVMLFIVGVFLLFFNYASNHIYSSFDDYFNKSTKYNNSEAQVALVKIQTVENSAWDYAFLAIFIGLVLQILLLSFATPANMAFFWIMTLVDIPVLIVGVVLSNIWQDLATNPNFTTEIARFPITNTILGTYYPMAIVIIIFVSAVVLYGKRGFE
jgi:hypothetical protein